MSKNMCRLASVLGSLVLVSTPERAAAQFYPANDPCYCVQAVPQTVYRSVPVTEYRQVQQTVRRPVVETQYVEQPVTEYRQVVETKVAEVPTVSYETATEWRTVQRDMGHWVTHYQPNAKVSPCEYDGRPNLLGWLNRTGYSIRSAFTPSYTAHRQYVPNVVAQAVPVTHQIPIHGTRQVTYNVTKSVPYTTTKRVAVNTVRYVDETVTAMQPVTVMRNVPIGSQVAYSYTPFTAGMTQTVLNPTPDPIGTAAQPNNRTAESPTPANNSNDSDDKFSPRSSNRRGNNNPTSGFNDKEMWGPGTFRTREKETVRPASMSVPVHESSAEPTYPDSRTVDSDRSVGDAPRFTAASTPSVVRVNQWVARSRPAEGKGPALVNPGVSVAGN